MNNIELLVAFGLHPVCNSWNTSWGSWHVLTFDLAYCLIYNFFRFKWGTATTIHFRRYLLECWTCCLVGYKKGYLWLVTIQGKAHFYNYYCYLAVVITWKKHLIVQSVLNNALFYVGLSPCKALYPQTTCIIQGLGLEPLCSNLIFLAASPILLDTRQLNEILSQVTFFLSNRMLF